MAICESCGSQNAPSALFCAHCGKPLKSQTTEHLPSAAGATSELASSAATRSGGAGFVAPHGTSAGNAITWPFQQTSWLGSLWILLLGWIPLFGWIAALTTSTGWMAEAIGRRGRGEHDSLPRARHILSMFFHGILYWLMFLLYIAVPIWLLSIMLTAETAIVAEEFNQWVRASLENASITLVNMGAIELGYSGPFDLMPQQDLLSLVRRWVEVYTAGFVMPVLWAVYAVPVFLAATIRFAVTGKLSSYFRPIANTGFVLRHFFGFVWLVAVTLGVNLIFGLIPLAGIYFTVTLGVWIVAYYAGRLGTKLEADH